MKQEESEQPGVDRSEDEVHGQDYGYEAAVLDAIPDFAEWDKEEGGEQHGKDRWHDIDFKTGGG